MTAKAMPPGKRPKLGGSLQQVFSQTAALQNGAHEGEERDGQQQLVGDDAEQAQRQVGHEGLWKVALAHGVVAKSHAQPAQGESHREAQNHRQHQAAEHDRG